MIFCTTINFFIVRYEKKSLLSDGVSHNKKTFIRFLPIFLFVRRLSPIFILWQKHEKQFCMFPTFIVFDL